MRVLICHSGSRSGLPSGETIIAKQDLLLLKQKGHHVEFFEFYPRYLNVKIFGKLLSFLSIVWSFPAQCELKKKIKEFNPDVIHFHSFFPFLSASCLFVAAKSDAAIVQTLHNLRYICVEGGFFRNNSYCDRCLTFPKWHSVILGCYRNHFYTLVAYIGGAVLRYLAFKKQMVDVFLPVSPNILKNHEMSLSYDCAYHLKINQVPRFSNEVKQFAFRDGVAFISRITSSKGSRVVLDLIDQLDFNFHIVGDGPELEQMKQHCFNHGHEHVKFYGQLQIEKINEILASVKCLLVPSQCGEAFSLIAAEALAVGTPVIASDLGGLADLINNSGGGVVSKFDKVADYVKAVKSICANEEKWMSFSQKGWLYVRTYHNDCVAAQMLEEAYDKALKKHDC